MNHELWFDVNASTPVDERVLEAALPWMRDGCANPSSAHPEGRRAAAAIARAREQLAAGIGAEPDEIFFTSGGSESNNWALTGSALAAGAGHLVTTAIEHKSVLATVRELERRGFRASTVPPARDGAVRAADVLRAVEADTLLVSVMLANNETGVLQPAASIGAECRARGVRFHVDATAALGKAPVDVRELCCDLLSLSSHKLYAPKGCGILYVRRGTRLVPLIHGCGQQGGMRGGTENTAGAVAFGAALERLRAGAFGSPRSLGALRDELHAALRASFPGIERNGAEPALANTLNVWLPGADAPALVAALGARGISVSAGAAGAGGAASHVLEAMGLGERARSSLRLSLGAHSTAAGVRALVAALRECLAVPESARAR